MPPRRLLRRPEANPQCSFIIRSVAAQNDGVCYRCQLRRRDCKISSECRAGGRDVERADAPSTGSEDQLVARVGDPAAAGRAPPSHDQNERPLVGSS